MNWKAFSKVFCKKSWKKIMLGTSDAWSTIRLSHRPNDPTYYIVNWQIFRGKKEIEKVTWQLQQVSRRPNWLLTTNYHWFLHCCWMCCYLLEIKILDQKVSYNASFMFSTLNPSSSRPRIYKGRIDGDGYHTM